MASESDGGPDELAWLGGLVLASPGPGASTRRSSLPGLASQRVPALAGPFIPRSDGSASPLALHDRGGQGAHPAYGRFGAGCAAGPAAASLVAPLGGHRGAALVAVENPQPLRHRSVFRAGPESGRRQRQRD